MPDHPDHLELRAALEHCLEELRSRGRGSRHAECVEALELLDAGDVAGAAFKARIAAVGVTHEALKALGKVAKPLVSKEYR